MKKRFWQVAICAFLISRFFNYSFASLSFPVKDFKIPDQLGSIKEVFEVGNQGAYPERTIVQIQDAHCNYEAQKNMAQVLEYLVKEYNLKTIMVEGGSGNVSLSFLRAYSDKKSREEIADKYLKAGKISGEEYLDIVSEYPIELYGIEDEALYDAHMAAFEKIDAFREEGLRELEGLSNIVNSLKSFIYNEELIQLEEKKAKYEDKAISLVEYCQYLTDMAKMKGLNLKDYAQLVRFYVVARLEKEIDFKTAESQRDAFIKDLAKLLDERGVQNLILMSQSLKAKIVTPEKYYSFLKDTGAGKLDLKGNYPQLNAYITYVTTSKDIDSAGLLKEIGAIEEEIKESCLTNNEQRRLSEIAKSNQILSRVLNLELTPEDYQYFQENRLKFSTASWIDFLNENCARYNLTIQASASNLIDENLTQLDGFYQLGLEREKAFIKNMAEKMNESDQKLVVLITGGFHTPGITQLLKEQGYSYVVVTPAITQKTDSSIYFSVLRGKKEPLEEALNEEE